jgi:DNA-directed RNA polymerase sigma subunit (sigma70/sigma32)
VTPGPSNSEALKMIRQRYRKTVRSEQRLRADRAALRQAITAARAEGYTLQSIGDQMGVSPQRVGQILDAA